MNFNWYLVQAKGRQEFVAERNLKRLGVEVYNPCFKQYKSVKCQNSSDRKVPLFPGYLFVRIDISTEFRKVTYAHGVCGVVKFGSAPTVVEEEVVQSIKAKEKNGLISLSSPSAIKSGDVICINNGPMQGFDAIFEQELNGVIRVALLLKTVAFQGRLVIDRDCLAM